MAGIREIGGIVIEKYSEALFQLGSEQGQETLSELQREAEELAEALKAAPELARILVNPCISADEKTELLSRLLKPSDTMLGFLDTVFRKNRQEVLPAILEAFIAAVGRGRSIRAQVYSAQPLAQQDIERIADILTQKTDKQIYLDISVEPSLIGGIQVYMEGFLLDTTVKGRLERMRSALTAMGG